MAPGKKTNKINKNNHITPVSIVFFLLHVKLSHYFYLFIFLFSNSHRITKFIFNKGDNDTHTHTRSIHGWKHSDAFWEKLLEKQKLKLFEENLGTLIVKQFLVYFQISAENKQENFFIVEIFFVTFFY